MKLALIVIGLILVSNVFGMEELRLDFSDTTEVQKVVMNEEILLSDLSELHRGLDFDNKRMIAGEFEGKKKKKSYTEGLRSKLDNCSGYSRF